MGPSAGTPARGRRALAFSPQTLVVAGFAALILIGSLLLLLPWSRTGDDADPLTALFTATSAVCVTGLTVVDFPAYYTGFGQAVVLGLIQVGGLGVMTGAALVFGAVGRRLSLRSQAALQDSLLQGDAASDFRQVFRWIVVLTFTIEAIGAVLLYAGFLRDLSPAESVFPAVFHAVSAFCNAGFSTFSDSLIGFQGRVVVLGTIMALIVLGGLGGIVLVELVVRRGWDARYTPSGGRRLSVHTRTVLWASAILLAGGAVALLLLGLTPEETGVLDRVEAALFQSVTARTAGFNTVTIGALPASSLLLLALLMFIGGSPGSCAGGIKTTTAAVWVSETWSSMRRREEVLLFDRAVRQSIVRRAMLLINISIAWNAVGVLLLVVLESGDGLTVAELLFEQVSAFATVGLSTGVTPGLSGPSQVWIIVTMFFGRLGPLLLTAWALTAEKSRVRRAEGRVLIG